MTDQELEQRIRVAVEHAAPDDVDRILALCRQEDQIRGISSASVPGIGSPAVPFRVILDVNPSVYLEADEEENVLCLEPLNEDAMDMPEAEDLLGLPLETVVDAIVEYMVHEGYLSETQNSILVSVEEPCVGGSLEIQKKVSDIVEEVMEESLGETGAGISVLIQTVDGEDEELAELALEYGISIGKAALIRKVAVVDAVADAVSETVGEWDFGQPAFGELAGLTVNEIALIAQDFRIPDSAVKRTGRASERAYIGHDGALRSAMDYVGLEMSQLIKPKVTFDVSGGRMVYEVKLKTTDGTLKCVIDARTGEVIHGKKGKKIEEERRTDMGKKKKKYKKYYQANYAMNGMPAAAQSAYGAGQPAPVPAGAVGEQVAKEAALRHAGVAESQAVYVYCNPQIGHGPDHYDVKFVANGFKYKYAIGLFDGAVLGRAVKNKAAKGKYIYEGNYHEHYAPMGPGMGQPAAAPVQMASGVTSEGLVPPAEVKPVSETVQIQETVGTPDDVAPPVQVKDAVSTPVSDGVTPPAPVQNAVPTPVQGSVAAPASIQNAVPISDFVPNPVPDLNTAMPAAGSMISEQAAFCIALQHAGLAQNNLIRWKVKLRSKHGRLLYRFKFKIPGFEHEIDVDAYSGAVTKSHKEVDY